MNKIKPIYFILLPLVGLSGVFMLVYGFCTKALINTGPAAVVFIALFAAIVALAIGDKAKPEVKISIEGPYIIPDDKDCYTLLSKGSDVNEDLLHYYEGDKFDETQIETYQIAFEITNTSSFGFKNPFVTFKLPNELTPPVKSKAGVTKHDIRYFSSNMANSQAKIQAFKFRDSYMVSNSNLPYLNKTKKFGFWFRMALSPKNNEDYEIEISVNCDNAEGVTQFVKLNPKKIVTSQNAEKAKGLYSHISRDAVLSSEHPI